MIFPTASTTSAILLILAFTMLPAIALSREKELIRNKRIVGPAEKVTSTAKARQFPSAVALHGHVTEWLLDKGFLGIPIPNVKRYSCNCGATVIASNAVITAAHCVTKSRSKKLIADKTWRVYMHNSWRKPGYFSRFLSSSLKIFDKITKMDLRKHTDLPRHAHVKRIVVHPNYDPETLANDIAIVFTTEIKFKEPGNYVNRAELPSSSALPTQGTVCQYAGWGCTDNDSGLEEHLLSMNFTILHNDRCYRTYGSGDAKSAWSENLCTKGRKGSLCSGDSGGGLFCKNPSTGESYLAGVASSGAAGPDSHKYPANFARVASHLQWIQQQL